eukprot:COSAG02_NODE_929_length_15840_cov_55.918493_2_plen_229_part_00
MRWSWLIVRSRPCTGTPKPSLLTLLSAQQLAQRRGVRVHGTAASMVPEPEPEPEPELQPAVDEQGCVDKGMTMVLEYKETLSVLPLYWKIIWAVVLLLWVPIAYTVAAPVPGSMLLFLLAWTSFVLRRAGQVQEEPDADPRRTDIAPPAVQVGGVAGSAQLQHDEAASNRTDGGVWTTRGGMPVTAGPPLPSVASEDIPAGEAQQPVWFVPTANPLFQEQQPSTVMEV